MTIPIIIGFQVAMQEKLQANSHKVMIDKTKLENHLIDQYIAYFKTKDKKHLINMANYCAMIWNK